MIRHILKLIKKRFGSNLWILAELLVVFMILWMTVDYFVQFYVGINRPVGFNVENVYRVTVALRPSNSPAFITYEEGSVELRENYLRLVSLVERHPDVEAVSVSSYSLPYDYSNMGRQCRHDSTLVYNRLFQVTPDYFRVFGIRPLSGGKPEDLAARLGEKGMLSAGLAGSLFGRTDVVGEEYYDAKDTVLSRIVAVTEPVRGHEYDSYGVNSAFSLLDLPAFGGDRPSERGFKGLQLCFRTRSGVAGGPDYAARFLREMRQQLRVGNYYISDVQPFEVLRTRFLETRMETSERKVFSVLAVFFLVNVFLAVIGTFWFHVIRRRSELGLRMAMGSKRRSIRYLMIAEGLLLLTIAAVPAFLLFVNLAYLDVFATQIMPMTVGRFLAVGLATWSILALVIILAIWYPARKAARLAPADALHYE